MNAAKIWIAYLMEIEKPVVALTTPLVSQSLLNRHETDLLKPRHTAIKQLRRVKKMILHHSRSAWPVVYYVMQIRWL